MADIKGLSTIQQDFENYSSQLDHNNDQMDALFNQLFPDLNIPYQDVYQIISFLQETKVNSQIIPKVIRGVHNLIIGTGRGQVIIHIQKDSANIQVRESDEDIKLR